MEVLVAPVKNKKYLDKMESFLSRYFNYDLLGFGYSICRPKSISNNSCFFQYGITKQDSKIEIEYKMAIIQWISAKIGHKRRIRGMAHPCKYYIEDTSYCYPLPDQNIGWKRKYMGCLIFFNIYGYTIWNINKIEKEIYRLENEWNKYKENEK